MKLLLISPEADDPRELPALPRLFAAGLASYHVRKPAWDRARLSAFLAAIPAALHPRLVLHSHHDLAPAHIHFTDTNDPPPPASASFTSRACHDVPTLRAALGRYSRVLLSPIFPSLSKPGHAPDARLSHAAIADVLLNRTPAERGTEVVALGGIDSSRLAACRALGFDGVAALGAVWQAPDPVSAFSKLFAKAR